MPKLLTATLVTALVAGLFPLACGGGGDGVIEVGQNVRQLCNYPLSGVREETRCANDSVCTQVDEFCWQPAPIGGAACEDDADCAAEEFCHQGYCYPACGADDDCGGDGLLKCLDNGRPSGGDCAHDDQCQEGWTCDGGSCRSKSCRSYGYCRQCGRDGQCPTGVCDHGWCRAECEADGDCDTGLLCTGGICRPPHATDFSFTNVGDRDLEIYPGQTVVRGDADAAVFCDLQWESDKDPIVLAPDDSAMLRVRFRPAELGAFRAWIDIHSNDKETPVLPLLMCGEAVAAECVVAYDGDCPPCPSCTADDFAGYETKDPVCP